MRFVGLALAATLVGGAMFGVQHLVAIDGLPKKHAGGARARRGPGDHARLAALLARVAAAGPDEQGEDETDPELDLDDEPASAPDDVGTLLEIDGIPIEIERDDHEDGGEIEVEVEDEELDEAIDPDSEPPVIVVRGYVVGPGDLDGVQVTFSRGERVLASMYTDGAGAFTTDVEADTFGAAGEPLTLRAKADDGWEGEQRVTRFDAPIRVDLRTRVAIVSGTIVDGGGRPLAFVDVAVNDDPDAGDSTHLGGEFQVRLPEGRRATLVFTSFGTEIARYDLIPHHEGDPVRVVARTGRSITCPLARIAREIDARGLSSSVSYTDGLGWGLGRRSSHGLEVEDLTVIPGPRFEQVSVELSGTKQSRTATIDREHRTCVEATVVQGHW